MKQSAIKLAVLSALGIISSPAFATGFVSLPTTGFTNSDGQTSPYLLCNQTGNFGSGDSTEPTTGANNTCAIFIANRNATPITGYTMIASQTSRNIVMNNSYTNNTNVTVAKLDEAVWKNSGTGTNESCVYGVRFTMQNVDYRPTVTGTQTLEINGFARAGFSSFTGSDAVKVAYFYSSISDEVLFRAARSYTSVQHRADLDDEDDPATGYKSQPPTSGSTASNAISGVPTYDDPLLVPTSSQQSAAIAANWVEFTTDNNFLDDDGSSLKDSSQLYVQVTGTGACPAMSGGVAVVTNDAYSFRQTGQEEAPLIEFKVPGYIPSAGNTNTP